MRFSENLSNIASAFAKVQAEIKNPIKNQTNKGVMGSPKYANLEDTLQEYVRPILAKHGMSVFQSIKTDDAGNVGVCTVLLHESGEFIEGDFVFCEVKIPTNASGKEILTQGQATGVNITYLRRYSLNAALGINGDKDTDGSYGDDPPEHQPKKKEIPAPRMTYEEALAYKLSDGKTIQEVWKEDFDRIKALATDPNTDGKVTEAIGVVSAKIKEFNSKKETKKDAQ
jgi:hypothetical protein